ncbi:PA14 domain-containing protein [Chitinophaga rhizophila]|uniref:PA14 domain-containing protein n=1 Tax=Chitinophaga rhizophila TaxID=2866212 RepID=A0ABS7G4Z1_9BACT|nr:hypothetical protein [Chitinophaga rhizophila]MBW8682704.1 hypothetical protein [Chitinophaga rhizophila]
MKVRTKRGRIRIACFFLGLLVIQGLTPTVAWALTSGPVQPEAKQFEAAGTSDMVDLFSGDFQYNIPLLDVGGYPVNLNYKSGVGMDDEASWVGLGWNLNAGAMNRQLRGIADDSDGDTVRSENYMKPKITGGGKVMVRGELFGSGKKGGTEEGTEGGTKVSGSLSLGIFNDNYTGYGAEFGANAGISISLLSLGKHLPGFGAGAGVGLNSNTSDGVTVTPNVSLSARAEDEEDHTISASTSLATSYNTRQGLKSLSLSTSYSIDKGSQHHNGATINYNTPTFYPQAAMSFKSTNATYSGDFGGAAFGVFGGVGATGYISKREVRNEKQNNRAFGFLYAHKGSKAPDALMDFMREKNNPVVPELNNTPVPIATPDVFSYSSQLGGGQLRLSRMSSGVLFDNASGEVSDNQSLSAEYGVGKFLHMGVNVYYQDIVNKNGKWKNKNKFLPKGDFAEVETLEEEHAYFRQTGEKHVDDERFLEKISGEEAISIPIKGKEAQEFLKTSADRELVVDKSYKRDGRQLRRTGVMYLTAAEAMRTGLEKQIRNYPLNRLAGAKFQPTGAHMAFDTISRIDNYRRRNHISEMTVTGDDGKRLVYGLPVYNIRQDEYSFASHARKLDTASGLASFDVRADGKIEHKDMGRNNNSVDEYYHKESQPAYASSYMLTGILSPDYVDMTGDGITEDDRGTAFKFNYSKVKRDFHWRSPYTVNSKQAQFNKNLQADPDDDKASFVCGQKELWYLHSIESKTMVAYFITEDRRDAIGADWLGNRDTLTKQQVLKEIRLYSKNNLITPIKTVVFDYDYSLCPNVPNSLDNKGKLTLKSVYFRYASSTKGKHHPYEFTYATNASYNFLSVDRWGSYKPRFANIAGGFPQMRNDEFPYATQRVDMAASFAGTWHLSKIKLPTGGVIHVDYESDDYAYVQDKKATVMSAITGMFDGDGKPTANLVNARSFDIKVDNVGLTTTDREVFKEKCLNGEEYLYMKLYVNVSNKVLSTDEAYYDYIPCYARIKDVNVANGVARVRFEDDTVEGVKANPFASATWQRMRLDYPRYVYPGFNNRIKGETDVESIVRALGNAFGNLSELWQPFVSKSLSKRWATNIKLGKSYARIGKLDGKKLGGGSRVKRIRMSDEWSSMVDSQRNAVYGQEYDYTTTRGTQVISSGVAAYEPMIGSDENPLRQPLKYAQSVKWSLDNFFYMEEPFGETLYPSPQVGYREVKVRSLGADGIPDPLNKTGWLSYEFYTAKEYPVYLRQTPLQKYVHNPDSWSSFFGGMSVYEMSMSQGYTIFLNDMHGKSKAERVYNQKGQEIASTEYSYNDEEAGGAKRLKNIVDVVDYTGTISRDQVIGRDIDVFSDMQESEMKNTGQSVNFGVDIIPFFTYTLPIFHFPLAINDDYRLFRSASVLKTVEYSGVVKAVRKIINGSSTTASYLLFDKYSGEPVLTQSENEFEDPVYSLNIPAYWMYEGMGMAYKTLGTVFPEFTTDNDGLPDAKFRPFLAPGDELINTATGFRSWVIKTPASQGSSLRVIERTGRLAKGLKGPFKVCRSGYRNILSAPATAITSLKNPVIGNKLVLLGAGDLAKYKVINATAVLYDEAWGQAADCSMVSCPPGYQESADGRCYLAPNVNRAHEVIKGSQLANYGVHGGIFFADTSNVGDAERSLAPIWTNRLRNVGVWMNDVTPNYHWWGFEKCITIDTDEDVFIGHAADQSMKIFIDGMPYYHFDNGSDNISSWNIRSLHLSKGKHIFRIEASTARASQAMGFELYVASKQVLFAGTSPSILEKRLYSTEFLKNDPDALLFVRNGENGAIGWANYTCATGKNPDLCDGPVNCGYAEKGSCPEGYTRSADGLTCIPKVQEDMSAGGLAITAGKQYNRFGENGAWFYDLKGNEVGRSASGPWAPCGTGGGAGARTAVSGMAVARDSSMAKSLAVNASASSACGRLNDAGIWFSGGPYMNQWIGINRCITVPESKVYYMGMAVDNQMRVFIDGKLTRELMMTHSVDVTPFTSWRVYPVYLTAGQHVLTIEAMDKGGDYSVALELYDNSVYDMLRAVRLSDLKILFTTANLRNQTQVDTYLKDDVSGQIIKRRYSCASGPIDVCSGNFSCPPMPLDNSLNPYLLGYLGNWLPYKQMGWLTSRTGQDLINKTPVQGAGVRTSGAYGKFRAFWVYNSGWSIADNVEWVTSNTMTLYDPYSQELETKNALDLYSAARYGYKSTLPVAVGANMRQREIFYEGLEDYKFNRQLGALPVCDPDEFNIGKLIDKGGNTVAIDSNEAHSGNYSLKLNGSIDLKTHAFTYHHMPGIYLENNASGEYRRKADGWLGLRGFCPVTGSRYIFSAWVKDNAPAGGPGISVIVNDKQVELKKVAVVEGWKLVEGVLNLAEYTQSANLAVINMKLQGSGCNLDDIRIFPYDGQLKTFSYDDTTQRVMAELDENNYATFYEYDDEGSLVRVKKETERGIMTIKESRSAYRKSKP